MAKIYANLIRKGLKTLPDVPEPLQIAVRNTLTEWGIEVTG